MAFTTKQLQQAIKSDSPKYVSLLNEAGTVIISNNQTKPSDQEHFKKIVSLLERGKSIPDGVYTVQFRNSLRPGASVASFQVIKGNGAAGALSEPGAVVSAPQPVKPMEKEKKSVPDGYSVSSLLELHGELGELRAKCASQEQLIKSLQEDITELEDEIAEAESKSSSSMADNSALTLLAAKAMEALTAHLLPAGPAAAPGAPAAAPGAQAPGMAAAGPPQLTYEQLLSMLANSPELVNQLSNDLTKINEQRTSQPAQEAAAGS